MKRGAPRREEKMLEALPPPPDRWRRAVWIPGRPESYQKGKRVVSVAPRALKEWERTVGFEWRKLYPGPPYAGPVLLELGLFTTIKHKDLDNMVKAVIDGLKNVAFLDDDRVYRIEAWKEPALGTGAEGVQVALEPWFGPAFAEHLGGK